MSSYLKHDFSLIISGDSLTHIICEDELVQKLIKITDECKIVICGRLAAY